MKLLCLKHSCIVTLRAIGVECTMVQQESPLPTRSLAFEKHGLLSVTTAPNINDQELGLVPASVYLFVRISVIL